MLDAEPEFRHVVVTCNEQGSLARDSRLHEKVHVITLPSETHDKSLVMTSSFTNLLLAARFLGMLERPDEYRNLCESLGKITEELIRSSSTSWQRLPPQSSAAPYLGVDRVSRLHAKR
jgi:tagatose-6-phosphate ketose/aldose isomerase